MKNPFYGTDPILETIKGIVEADYNQLTTTDGGAKSRKYSNSQDVDPNLSKKETSKVEINPSVEVGDIIGEPQVIPPINQAKK